MKAVGTGHSFTATAATDGVLIRPQLLTGIRDDRPRGRHRHRRGRHAAQAGSTWPSRREGLSLTNMGDIMEQTVPAPPAPAPTAPAATRRRSPPRSRA